jgi:hypothetical protein
MGSTLLPFYIAAACFSLLVSAAPANAQCRADLIGFRIVTDNPFHAEIVTTHGPTQPESIVTRYPQLIARDSQGRVRIDRVTEEVRRGTGPDSETGTETHIIMICDPVAHTTTILNISKLTAEIVHLSPNGLSSSPVQGTPHTFCSSRMPSHLDRIAGADLGVQTIQGVEAHGARTHFGFASFSAGNTASGTSSDYVRDLVLRRTFRHHSDRLREPEDRREVLRGDAKYRSHRARSIALPDSAWLRHNRIRRRAPRTSRQASVRTSAHSESLKISSGQEKHTVTTLLCGVTSAACGRFARAVQCSQRREPRYQWRRLSDSRRRVLFFGRHRSKVLRGAGCAVLLRLRPAWRLCEIAWNDQARTNTLLPYC